MSLSAECATALLTLDTLVVIIIIIIITITITIIITIIINKFIYFTQSVKMHTLKNEIKNSKTSTN